MHSAIHLCACNTAVCSPGSDISGMHPAGLTLNKATVNLQRAFEPGMAYVALR